MYTFPIIHTLACLPIRSKHSYSYTSLPHHLTLDFAWLRLRFTPTLLPRMQAACVHACSPPNKVGNTTAPTPLPTLSTSFRSFPPTHPYTASSIHPPESLRPRKYRASPRLTAPKSLQATKTKRRLVPTLPGPAIRSAFAFMFTPASVHCLALRRTALHCATLRYAAPSRTASSGNRAWY